MNNKRYGILVTGIALILVLVLLFEMKALFPAETAKIPEEYAQNIVTYENGDYIYIPGEEHLEYDEDDCVIYYDNEILVYLDEALEQDEKRELADSIDGVIVGDVSGYVNVLQIAFAETDYPGIFKKAETLMAYNTVVYAGCDTIYLIEETYPMYTDENPWSLNENEMISDKWKEHDPDGNDWWAEAIGAYTAWGYGQNAVSVNVGIIDNGFDLEHEEFEGRISMLEGYTTNVEEESHGTPVAGIIGAADNDVGLRGVHSGANLICADWSLDGTKHILEDEDGDFTGAVLTEIINQMAKRGVKVVNLSFGLTPVTLSEFTAGVRDSLSTQILDIFCGKGEVSDLSYENYLAMVRGAAKQSAQTCIILIDQLVKNGADMLFVQGAGNGWNNGGDNGYEAAEYAGLFASVTEKRYHDPFWRMNAAFAGYMDLIPYEEIKQHILVVGAVENVRDDDGNYRMTQYSNHGESVDICAPGGDQDIFTTANGSGYTDSFSGTSAAAPMVTGSAALLWGINPELTAAEVRDLLLNSAASEAYGYYFDDMRYPMLNIGNAAKRAYDMAHPEEFTDNAILSDWLGQLAEEWGVIEVGTEEYPSKSGGFEHVIPSSRILGLLAAETDDYDNDGSDELFVVRVEPDSYEVGAAQRTSTTYITLEMYDVKDGEIFYSGRTFPILGLPETEYQTSIHVFKTTAEGEGIRLYFDYFFNFNSQTFGTVQLEYDGDALRLTDGAEMDEFAYSSGCYQAVSDKACETILGRQSFDIGQNGWEENVTGSWGEYFEDEELERAVGETLRGYSSILRGMGLTDTTTRSMYASTDGAIHTSLQDVYSRCCLKPAEHYTHEGQNLEEICSLIAPYGQGSVTLTVEDHTSLLYPYRTGKKAAGTTSGQSTGEHNENGNSTNLESTVAEEEYDSAGDVFYAFADILLNGSPEDVVALYSGRQLSYEAEQRGCDIAYLKELLVSSWEASWETMRDNSTWQYELKEETHLGSDEIYEKFGRNSSTPDEAVKMKIVGKSVQDKTFYIYAVCYEGRWYLSINNS